jgi:hypothetical protein
MGKSKRETRCYGCGGIFGTECEPSRHQPTLRCMECFKVFAEETTAVLEGMLKRFEAAEANAAVEVPRG